MIKNYINNMHLWFLFSLLLNTSKDLWQFRFWRQLLNFLCWINLQRARKALRKVFIQGNQLLSSKKLD